MYTSGNPLNFSDPSGHQQCVTACDASIWASIRDAFVAMEAAIASAGPAGLVVAGGAGVVAVSGTALANSTMESPDYPPIYPDYEAGAINASAPFPGSSTVTIPTVTPLVPPMEESSVGGFAPADVGSTIFETSGTYEFPDQQNPGKTYVGQSGNVERRLRTHNRNGRLADAQGAIVTEIPGGKFNREIAEQNRINELGGVKGGQVSNKRNPIGVAREERARQNGLKQQVIR